MQNLPKSIKSGFWTRRIAYFLIFRQQKLTIIRTIYYRKFQKYLILSKTFDQYTSKKSSTTIRWWFFTEIWPKMSFWAQMPKYGNLGLDPLRMMIFHQVMIFFQYFQFWAHCGAGCLFKHGRLFEPLQYWFSRTIALFRHENSLFS